MFGFDRRGPAVALRDALPVRVTALAAVCLMSLWLLSGSVAQAATPGASCQPYSSKPCMFPFPDNRLTKPDKASVTGLQLNLPQAAMPENLDNIRIGTGPYDQSDGFSPGSAILLHISQLDTQKALNRTHAVGLENMSAYKAKNAPIVVIDEKTGQRQMIYAQLDANARSAATTDLMIQPGARLAGRPHLRGRTARSAQRERTADQRAQLVCEAAGQAQPATGRARAGAPLHRDLQHAQARAHRQQQDAVRGLGLHRRFDQEPHRTTARDPQQRVRPTGGYQPRRRPGSGQRSVLRGHQHEVCGLAERRDRHRRHRHLPGSLLPRHLRRQRDHELPLQLERALCDSHPDPGQRCDRRVRVRRPVVGDAIQPGTHLALRARAAGRHERGHRSARRRRSRAPTTWSCARPTGGGWRRPTSRSTGRSSPTSTSSRSWSTVSSRVSSTPCSSGACSSTSRDSQRTPPSSWVAARAQH